MIVVHEVFCNEFEICWFSIDLGGTYKLENYNKKKPCITRQFLRNKFNIPIKRTEESHKNNMQYADMEQ